VPRPVHDHRERFVPFARTLAVAVCTAAACATAVATSPAAGASSPPTVARLSFSNSAVAGGARLTLTGTGFTHVTAVSFGRSRGTALRVTSTRSLSVVVPRHAVGLVDVRVVARSGSSPKVKNDELTYVAPPSITSLSVTSGSTAGGMRLVVSGTSFTSVQSVSFGSSTGTALKVTSTRQLTVTVPDHAAATVPVRVRTAYGLSPVTSHTFTYVVPGQLPVTDLTVIDTTETSDRLSWELPSTGAPSQLVVRRAEGSTAPATPADGEPVTVAPTDTAVTDTGLIGGTQYSYAVFAEDAAGRVSPAAVATSMTATSPRPAAPADVQLSPLSPSGAQGCPTTPALVGNDFQLAFGGQVADPDDPGRQVQMMTQIVDYGPSGTASPTTVLAYADDVGWSGTVNTPAVTYIHYDLSDLADGHEFGISAVSTDKSNPSGVTATSEPSVECRFWLDRSNPNPPMVVSSTLTPSKPVGQTVKVVVSATDPTPKSGRASGISHFLWGLDESDGVDTVARAHVTKGTVEATISFAPTVWGTNFLYVQAVDAAGNVSGQLTVPFYTYDPAG
jgi:hypothetical protein